MAHDAQRTELGDFLKLRRSQLSPAAVGLPDDGVTRRVPGLRREEVARLASVSTDYITRLEQGRIRATPSVLKAVSQALRLDEDQRAYVAGLADAATSRPRRRKSRPTVRPQLLRLLEAIPDRPALIFGPRTELLAWNELAAALYTDFSKIPEAERNWTRMTFCHPDIRAVYAAEWETAAKGCVARLRMQATRDLDDPALAALIGDLSLRDGDFRRWWASHHVDAATSGTKTLRHPAVGDITLDWEHFRSVADDEQELAVMSAAPDTPAHDALAFLSSWTADDAPAGLSRAEARRVD